MKTTVSILLVVALSSLSSCIYEEKEIFSTPAAVRLNEAMAEAESTLVAAENGWAMHYFATSQSEGYTFLVKFAKDGMATVAGKNKYFPEYTTDNSTFEVIGDNGPVLTFNSYNKVLHLFSNPKDPAGSTSLDGLGLQGDYEFIILESTPDKLRLKGKKRGTAIYLTKLASEVVWEEYMRELEKMDKLIFNAKVPKLSLSVKENQFIVSDGSSHILTLTPVGDNVIGKEVKLPFIVTMEGIRLYEPFTVGDVSVQTFNLKEDKSELVATESQEARIAGPNIVQFFTDPSTWLSNNYRLIDATKLGGDFVTLYQAVVDECLGALKEQFGFFCFRTASFNPLPNGDALSLVCGKRIGNLKIETKIVDADKHLITFKDLETPDTNGALYCKHVPAITHFLKALCSRVYILSTDAPLCPVTMRLTDVENPANYITVSMN